MFLISLLTPGLGLTPGPAVSSSSARARLLQQLPRRDQPPIAMPFDMINDVEELEAQGMIPATPDFLALGLNGRWECRAILAPPKEKADAEGGAAADAGDCSLQLQRAVPGIRG